MNRIIYRSEVINRGIDKELLEIKFSNDLNQLRRFNFRKLLQFFHLLVNLVRKIRKFRPDFIYFSIMPVGKGLLRDFAFVLIIKAFGVRAIYHLHNRGIARNSGRIFMRILYRYIFNNSYVIHLSERLMKDEIDTLGIKRVKRFIVPNGVKDRKQKTSYDSRLVNLLYLSNLFPQKGVLDLIRLYNDLALRYDHIHLNIVGGFPYAGTRKKVLSTIEELGLKSRISLLGPKYGKQKNEEFGKADLFVFPTSFRQECLPLVLLEAMSFELPVVASSEGAIPEIIEDGKDGFVVSLKDPGKFIKKMEELILDNNLRREMGRKARKKYLEKYTAENVEMNMRKLFENNILI